MNLRIFVVLILRRFLFYRLLLRLQLLRLRLCRLLSVLGILLFVLVFFLIPRAPSSSSTAGLCLLQQVSLKLAVLCREVNRSDTCQFRRVISQRLKINRFHLAELQRRDLLRLNAVIFR